MGKALLLDCDGVLADTEEFGHLVAFNQVFDEFGYPFRWSKEEYARLLKVGGGKERVRAYATATGVDLGFDGDLVVASTAIHRRKTEIYIELVTTGRLPERPGIRRLVDEVLDAGWTVAVASTSALESVRSVLRAVVDPEAFARVAGIFAGDVVENKKPAPDVYLLALDALGLDPADTVVIEDSEAGAAAAHAAGLKHLVTLSSFTGTDAFPDATAVVDSLGDPGVPVRVQDGLDVRNAAGLIDRASLERILAS
ncbi:HAD-IA family hydrolase [Propionicicella superfundia]|uniref:HAD-IA family hydrolase n=1 Tax=Propionicicella superfundia TaxID=348582 RepID=UPI0003FD47AB|nr:HAD-IA family hydrolase [Propionicicella superfundia]